MTGSFVGIRTICLDPSPLRSLHRDALLPPLRFCVGLLPDSNGSKRKVVLDLLSPLEFIWMTGLFIPLIWKESLLPLMFGIAGPLECLSKKTPKKPRYVAKPNRTKPPLICSVLSSGNAVKSRYLAFVPYLIDVSILTKKKVESKKRFHVLIFSRVVILIGTFYI